MGRSRRDTPTRMTSGRSPLRWISRLAVTTAVVASPEVASGGSDDGTAVQKLRGSSAAGNSGPISPPPPSDGPTDPSAPRRVLEEVEPEVHPRIYGGTPVASWEDYPWMVSLTRGNAHWCGGALIAPDYVITAGHCRGLDPDGPGPRLPGGITGGRLGSLDKTHDDAENGNVVQFEISDESQISRPNNYDEGLYRHDIMLIKLDTFLDPAVYPPIELAPQNFEPQGGQVLTTMGWGTTEDGSRPDYLLEVDVNYVPQDSCAAAYDFQFVEYEMMCAVALDSDACQGDSGGPLIVPGFPPTLVGTVSWGFGCASEKNPGVLYPGVYSRLSENYLWIKEELCSKSGSPPPWTGCPPNPALYPSPVQSSTTAQAPSSPVQASSTLQAPSSAVQAPSSVPAWPTLQAPTTTVIQMQPRAVKIEIMFDRHPMDIGWWVGCDGYVVRSVPHGSYSDSLGLSEVDETVPIPPGARNTCTVSIYDHWNDGLCRPVCDGHYAKVILQGEDGTEQEILRVDSNSFIEKSVDFPARRP